MTALAAILITQLLSIDYYRYEVFEWPENTHYSVNELRFSAYDDIEPLKPGQYHCFTFTDLDEAKVCGTIRSTFTFGATFITIDLQAGNQNGN